MSTDDKRAAYIEGLHQIADFFAEHPEVPMPYIDSTVAGKSMPTMYIYIVNGDQRDQLATIAKAMGRAEKNTHDTLARFEVHREFAGLRLVASASRDEVCERVVTGTREVTEEVPDPEALAAVPKVTRTKVVEDVEWVCQPLLKAPTSLLRVDAEAAA